NVEKLKNDLALNIASVYLEILNYKEQVKVAEDQLALTRLQIDRTRNLVEAGSSPEGDLLNIEAQGAQEESSRIAYQNGLDIAMLTLVQLLDLGAGEGFSVVVPDFSAYVPVDLAFSSEDIFKTARETFPQIKSASYNIRSADKALSVARAGFSPRISLSSSWSSSYSSTRQKVISIDEFGMPVYGPYSFNDQFNNNQNWSFGLNLSVPIFNGWQTRTSVDNAKIQRENARLQYSVVENQLFKDIQQSYIDALAAWKKFLSSEKSVQAQQEAFRYTEQKYEVGLVQFVEYSTAKNKLSLAQSELIQSKYNYIFRTKVLDFYRNIPISL
ncbi:MAG: TolC family protein, partial [Bacteroidales bacterium]|nr:TolC family protein [Bacteroidales bacterium]